MKQHSVDIQKCDASAFTSRFRGRLSHYIILIALVGLMQCSMPDMAQGQSASFRAVDTNSDGRLSFDELVAAFGRAGAERLLNAQDANRDRQLTIPELRETPGTNNRPGRGRDDDDDDRDDDDRDDDGENEGDEGGGDDGDSDGGDSDGGDGDGGDSDGGDD